MAQASTAGLSRCRGPKAGGRC